ncbi:MAG: hypothetical protein SVK08_08255 [Halobacteriota archaeon]|nr:hypothetical protein [Halobacteriota archaeon]
MSKKLIILCLVTFIVGIGTGLVSGEEIVTSIEVSMNEPNGTYRVLPIDPNDTYYLPDPEPTIIHIPEPTKIPFPKPTMTPIQDPIIIIQEPTITPITDPIINKATINFTNNSKALIIHANATRKDPIRDIVEIEAPEEEQVYNKIKAPQRVKLFGFLPFSIETQSSINSSTDEIENVDEPWWGSFFW